SYDNEHSTYTVDLQLEGPKTELSRGVDLLLTYGWWPADAAFLDADNGLPGQGARWRFTAAKSDAGDVRVKSEVRHIRVRLQPLRLNSDTLEAYFRVLKAPPKS